MYVLKRFKKKEKKTVLEKYTEEKFLTIYKINKEMTKKLMHRIDLKCRYYKA